MPAVRIPDSLREELAAMDLTIWIAMHPMIYPSATAFEKGRGHHDKTRVHVQISGPKLEISPWGYGKDIYEAVRHALASPAIIDRVPGLRGAMLRLEAACHGLKNDLVMMKWRIGGELEDEIPF